jgi:hypothetical protein
LKVSEISVSSPVPRQPTGQHRQKKIQKNKRKRIPAILFRKRRVQNTPHKQPPKKRKHETGLEIKASATQARLNRQSRSSISRFARSKPRKLGDEAASRVPSCSARIRCADSEGRVSTNVVSLGHGASLDPRSVSLACKQARRPLARLIILVPTSNSRPVPQPRPPPSLQTS